MEHLRPLGPSRFAPPEDPNCPSLTVGERERLCELQRRVPVLRTWAGALEVAGPADGEAPLTSVEQAEFARLVERDEAEHARTALESERLKVATEAFARTVPGWRRSQAPVAPAAEPAARPSDELWLAHSRDRAAGRHLAANLQMLRVETGLSVENLAANMGVGKGTLIALAAERQSPQAKTLRAIADFMRDQLHAEIRVSDLLTRDITPPRIGTPHQTGPKPNETEPKPD